MCGSNEWHATRASLPSQSCRPHLRDRDMSLRLDALSAGPDTEMEARRVSNGVGR
jgi:hypothetical protein